MSKRNSMPYLLCGLYVLMQLPFIDKAVHVDETLFLWTAEQILQDPIDFFGFSLNWYGWEMGMSEVMQNPPLVSYYLALFMKLGMRSEVLLHLAMLLPGALAVLGVYRLAGLFCSKGWLATLLLLLAPPFWAAGSSFMADVPLLAFWVWAVYAYTRGEREQSNGLRLAGALLATGALLCKYNGLALVPLLLVVSIVRHRGLRLHMGFLLLPVAAALAFHWATAALYGRGLVFSAMEYSLQTGGGALLEQLFVGLSFLGGCMLAGLLLSPFLWSWRGLALLLLLAVAAALAIGWQAAFGVADLSQLQPAVRWLAAVQAGLFITAGVQVFLLAGRQIRQGLDAESLLLVLWLAGQFVFATFVNWTVNTRTMLPLLPAAGILLVRVLESSRGALWAELGPRSARLVVPLAVAGLVGFSVAWCDARWASAGRDAAFVIDKALAEQQQAVYFGGHWGFQYYMEQRGFRPLDHSATDMKAGSVLVAPQNMLQRSLNLEHFEELWEFELAGCAWLSTKHESYLAGLYASIYGPMPYAFAPAKPHRFRVYRATSHVQFRTREQ